jgi:subtilisin family serine protease
LHHLDLVKLSQLMDRTGGSRDLRVAVIDGPVALDHPAFAGQRVFEVDSGSKAACQSQTNIACFHGTAVVGVMAAKRGFGTPAICPDCTFLLRPIFVEESDDGDVMPAASPDDLAAAITASVSAGANVINLSALSADNRLVAIGRSNRPWTTRPSAPFSWSPRLETMGRSALPQSRGTLGSFPSSAAFSMEGRWQIPTSAVRSAGAV